MLATKANLDVRKRIKDSKVVRHWMIANKLGISSSALSCKLRMELHKREKQEIYKAISELRKEIAGH